MVGRRGGRGGSKGGGSKGGIRKRKTGRPSAKNNPNRQRLAKVVARQDELEDSLGGIYEARQKALREARAGEHAAREREEQAVQDQLMEDGDSESDAETAEATTSGKPGIAYQSLVAQLDVNSRAVQLLPASPQPQAFASAPNVNLALAEKEALKDVNTATSTASLTHDYSGEAAAREAAHFCAEPFSEPKDAPAPTHQYSSPILIPGVAKVSIAPTPSEGADAFFSTVPLQNFGVNYLGLQPSVLERWRSLGECALDAKQPMAPHEALLAHSLRTYRDVLFCQPSSPLRERRVRELTAAHCLSHALRARSRVQRNDVKVRSTETAGPKKSSLDDKQDGEFRDQGFARPRVLILAPMRNDVYDLVTFISKLSVGTGDGETKVAQIANRDRFEEEFAPDSAEEEDDAAEEANGDGTGKKGPQKPGDWKHRFRGNVEDDFKLGISLTKKSVKLYSDFYQSDIIIASPLGLVRSMEVKRAGAGRKGTKKRADKDKTKAVDDWNSASAKLTPIATKKNFAEDDEADDDGFLSSIEICVLDGASTFKMQNWSLLLTTLERVNNMPSRPRDSDFSRVRPWALNEQMRLFRQTIVLTDQKQADVFSLFRSLDNRAGRVRLYGPPVRSGSIADVIVSMRQRFIRVPNVSGPVDAPDRRFEEFMSQVLPELRSSVDCQAMVVVPSYFDFVRVRNALVALEADEVAFHFASLSEYSKESDVARAKTRFFTGRVKLLVMTERVHYYWRSNVRGANTIVWYGVPELGHFYPEIVNTVAEAADRGRRVQSVVLYDEYDVFALERIVGTSRSKKMVAPSSRKAFLFT